MVILQHFIAEAKLKPDARIFSFTASHAWFIVTRAAREAGIKDLVNPESGRRHHPSCHRLRDAFATMAVLRDDSPDSMRVLQERMGHKNIATTWKYRKVAGQEQKEWLGKIFGEEDEN